MLMHIPRDKQRKYWQDTAPDGSCSLVALAQAIALLKENGTYRAVPHVLALDRVWMREELKALKLFLEKPENQEGKAPQWVGNMLPGWMHHGLSGEEGDPVNLIESEYVYIENLLEMASVLRVNVNIWQIIFTEAGDLEDKQIEHATKYQLMALVRDGTHVDIREATVTEWLDWFSVRSVNIMQTLQHYFVHPDLTVNDEFVATLKLLQERWG